VNGLLQGIVLCVGEALIALAPEDGWSLETATALEVCEAGAEVSVAVHLARLGVPVRFAGLVGDDPWGGRIRNALAREGVDVSTLGIHRSAPTGMYLKNVGPNGTTVHYYRRGSAASTMDHVPPAAHAGVSHIHLSGITPALAPQCARMIRQELTHKEGRSVSFDVNYRRALWPPDQAAPVLGELARQADIVFVGLDEAAALWGCQTAEQVQHVLSGKGLPAPTPAPAVRAPEPIAPPPPQKPAVSDALVLLATLQREARLVDFLKEDLSGYSDEQIGAAAREIHRDCGKVVDRMFGVQPVLTEEEGAEVTVPAGFDAARYRLTGKLTGSGPFQGRLQHHGWEATRCDVPTFTGTEAAARAIAAAEVEVE